MRISAWSSDVCSSDLGHGSLAHGADGGRTGSWRHPEPELAMQTPSTRRHDLDWIRVCAFGLLILYHVGMYYVSWDWHVKRPGAAPTIEHLMLLTAPWRLSLLFLVSGAATAFLIGQSASGFLHSAERRVGKG